MKKLVAVIFFGLLVGCSTVTNQRILTPYEVSTIPTDCLNQRHIINYLESQVKFANENNIKENLGVVKYKLWEVRTLCNGG
jgi:hypothetical protein